MDYRIYLSQPHQNGRETEYITKALSTNHLTLFGDNIIEFEKKMAQYLSINASLAVSCGTSALHLAMRFAGVEKGEYVFCSSLTFAASCNPILYQGGIPVFIDSEPESWNMSPSALEKAFQWAEREGKIPKAVVIVDLYGQPADYDKLIPICRKYGVPIIEDAAEALASEYHGRKCGTFGDYAAFSFNSNKIITTGGGGMVVSDDAEAIEKMRYWAAQAREPLPYYEHKEFGYQYRMSNILAGIGCAQIDSLDDYAVRRRSIFSKYQKEFANYPVKMMPIPADTNPNCWLSVISLEKSEYVLPLIKHLDALKIESRMVWKPMHLQPVFKGYLYFMQGDKDISRELFEQGVCLPSASVMTDAEQEEVTAVVKEFFDHQVG